MWRQQQHTTQCLPPHFLVCINQIIIYFFFSGSIYAELDVIYCFCIFGWMCFLIFFPLFDCFSSCHLLCRCACVLSLHLFPNLLIRAQTQSVSGLAFIMTLGKRSGHQIIISFSLVYICLDSSSVSHKIDGAVWQLTKYRSYSVLYSCLMDGNTYIN